MSATATRPTVSSSAMPSTLAPTPIMVVQPTPQIVLITAAPAPAPPTAQPPVQTATPIPSPPPPNAADLIPQFNSCLDKWLDGGKIEERIANAKANGEDTVLLYLGYEILETEVHNTCTGIGTQLAGANGATDLCGDMTSVGLVIDAAIATSRSQGAGTVFFELGKSEVQTFLAGAC